MQDLSDIRSELIQKYDAIAESFVLQAGKILNKNGIHLYVNYNTVDDYHTFDDNVIVYEQKYKLSFDSLDTSEHDAKIRKDAIIEVIEMLVNNHGYSPKSVIIKDIEKIIDDDIK